MNCKICGDYSNKRNICGKCKAEFPYKASQKESPRDGIPKEYPFNRKKEFLDKITYLVTKGVE